jgi:hypothetical protein
LLKDGIIIAIYVLATTQSPSKVVRIPAII